MMMFANPFRMILVPPSAVAPHMMVVPIAVVLTPIRVRPGPFRMMMVDPARMVVMPPVRIAPFMMLVPVTITVVRMCNHWRSREQRSQGCGGEDGSKFHSWIPPEETEQRRDDRLTSSITMHRQCQFQEG
jgi:hypothetical protein